MNSTSSQQDVMMSAAMQAGPAKGGQVGQAGLALATATLLWSGNFIIGRLVRDEVTPVTLNFLRWLLALAILLAIGWRDLWSARRVVLREWKLAAAAGLTGIAAFHTCVYYALRDTVALNALLLLAITPVAIMLLSRAMGVALRPLQAAGALVSLAGAALLIVRGEPAAVLHLQTNRGDLWMLAAVAIWAVYSVLLQRRPADLAPGVLLMASVAAGLGWLLPAYLWELGRGSGAVHLVPSVILGIGYIAIAASVVAFLLWSHGVAVMGPNRSGQFIHLMPVFGALLSWLFLDERIAGYHLAGAALVFAGIAVTQKSKGGGGVR